MVSHKVCLTFHHILLVVAIVVAVCGSVVDVKAMDRGVVITCWNILQEMEQRNLHVSRTTGGWKFYPSQEFNVHQGILANLDDEALWRMLGGIIIVFSHEVSQLLETRNKLPFL